MTWFQLLRISDMASTAGTHCIAELTGCPSTILDDVDALKAAMREAIDVAGATLLHMTSHQFTPSGVTVLALLAESHMSIHTWPQRGYAAVDLFTCGWRTSPRVACEHLAAAIGASEILIREVPRGEHVGDVMKGREGAVPQ